MGRGGRGSRRCGSRFEKRGRCGCDGALRPAAETDQAPSEASGGVFLWSAPCVATGDCLGDQDPMPMIISDTVNMARRPCMSSDEELCVVSSTTTSGSTTGSDRLPAVAGAARVRLAAHKTAATVFFTLKFPQLECEKFSALS